MLLKSMEIQGFKTFPDKTKLSFDRGITAVVGPNGSGKSNISDAVRWVLGEQSAKSLRCSKMEDVVFNGSDNRKRQGFAEVTLTIDNADRALPFGSDTVAVTRRYYRSGESEYLINKNCVRLKDIHELFMDTGLGRDGYSMIGQGKIDSIVASKSEERREIFEEAAGISRYRYRKLEAERKLSLTENNLVRLRDIVGELEQRVGPLHTQAQKAEAFLKLSEERKGLEIALWLDTLNKSSGILKEHEDKLAVARSQHSAAEADLETITAKIEEIYVRNGELSSKADSVRREHSKCIEEQNEKKSRISVLANDILHNNQTVRRLSEELEAIDAGAEDTKTQIEEKKRAIKLTEEKISSLQKDANAAGSELSEVAEQSGKSTDEFQVLSNRLTKLNIELSEKKVESVTSSAAAAELQNRVKDISAERKNRSENLQTLEKMLAGYDGQIQENEHQVQSLKNSMDGIEFKLAAKKKKYEQLKQRADEINLDANEKLRKARLLENLEQNLEGFAHSVKTVMQSVKSGALGGICGPVSRIISVPKEYAVAIETALGGAMQHIVTETQSDAKRAIRFLKSKEAGRATFLPVDTIKGSSLNESDLKSCDGFVGIASQLCRCEPKFNGILSSLLGRIVIAENLDIAAAIAKKFGYRFKVVSLDGQVVNAGGSLTGGSSNRKSGLLSRTAEIKELKEQSKNLFDLADKAKKECQNEQSLCAALEAQALGFGADYNRLLQESARIKAERGACFSEINAAKAAVEKFTLEIKTADEKLEQLSEKSRLADEETAGIEKQISECEQKMSRISGDRSNLTEKREEISAVLQNIRMEILSAQKDCENLKNEIALAQAADSQRINRRQAVTTEIEALEKLNENISKNIEELKLEQRRLQRAADGFEKDIGQIGQKRDELEKESADLRKAERDKTAERENIGREAARLEERKINLQKQYDDIIAKLWEEYEMTLKQAQEIGYKLESVSEGQKRLNEIKQKIRTLGNVNVSAIEEYKEVSERYEFISAQVNDVEKSKKEIENLISGLTHQMKEAFVVSFKEINANFTNVFRELFGGGTASLALSDPENILTSGIDIIVHPPGKIVSHLEALSGGEKALVAIALYFSIMKVRPAPFCILDEIEAALDDVNVDRFAKYMRTMCGRTQFICITHRRGTMEEADVLYGVTMQDKGVSKLLELKITEVAAKLGI